MPYFYNKSSFLTKNTLAEALGEVHNVVEVVEAGEVWTKHFLATKEVCEIGFGVIFTDVAVAGFVRLTEISLVLTI